MGNTVELTDSGMPRAFQAGPDPMIGRQLMHYIVEERIGQGGMSVVYRGIDQHLHRDVAIKVLHPFLAEKAECRARLAREARAVARLEHENILRIFDYSGNEKRSDGAVPTDDGFIVTELVPGDTLKRFAEDHDIQQLPELGAAITWQLLHALGHAHAQGVIHRDLKPENVMVRTDGVLKLMDFGIAQVIDAQSLTVTGTLLGSPAHMAPECIEGHNADTRSDIFSLGTVMYWLCTGKLPFSAQSPHALLKAIVEGRYTPIQKANARVSDDLARVMKRAMHTDPGERFATAQTFADALAEALNRSGIDVGTAFVSKVLKSPSGAFAGLSETVRTVSLSRATALLDDGQPAKAFSVLSRVLAEHPNDERAQMLLEAAAPGFEDEEEEEDRTEDEIEAVSPPGVKVVPAEVVAPVPPPTSRGGLALSLFGIVALVAAGALFWAREFRDAPAPTVVDAPEGAPFVDEPEMNIGVPAVTDVDTPEPTATKKETKRTQGADRGGRRARGPKVARRDGPPAREATDLDADAQKAASEAAEKLTPPAIATRPVTVLVNAPATLTVDDGPPQRVFGRQTVALPVGRHTLLFTAPAALDLSQSVTIPESGPPPNVTAQLKPKPGMLTVTATANGQTVNADIFVRSLTKGASPGRIVGTSAASTARPIPIYFAPREGRIRGTEEIEVSVTAPGHESWHTTATLTAGRIQSLKAVLKPRARDPKSPSP